MSRQGYGRLLIILGFAAALATAWATQDPARFATVTGALVPAPALALVALGFGLAGAMLLRHAREAAPPRAAARPAEPAAPVPDIEPEAGVETIRRRLREAEKKE